MSISITSFKDILDIALAVFKFIFGAVNRLVYWWNFTLPANRLFDNLVNNKILLRIFVKDLIVEDNTINEPKLSSIEGPTTQKHPNIEKVWPEVECRGIARIQNLLGQLGKREKLEIVEMSKGYELWDCNMIILGGQAAKSMDFYKLMDDVAFSMDENDIYDNETNIPIEREDGYGYGIILKARDKDKWITGFLLGGYGTLGTAAAIYYFCQNIPKLGKEFGKDCFGVLVRAKVTAGEQSAQRLKRIDKRFHR